MTVQGDLLKTYFPTCWLSDQSWCSIPPFVPYLSPVSQWRPQIPQCPYHNHHPRRCSLFYVLRKLRSWMFPKWKWLWTGSANPKYAPVSPPEAQNWSKIASSTKSRHEDGVELVQESIQHEVQVQGFRESTQHKVQARGKCSRRCSLFYVRRKLRSCNFPNWNL